MLKRYRSVDESCLLLLDVIPATEASAWKGKQIRTLLAAIALAMIPLAGAYAQDPDGLEDDDYHFGILEYEISCLPCHGADGQGNGPLAEHLKVAPSDLTQIAERNGGQFPTIEIYEIVDGRAMVSSHNAREMPVWGERYRVEVADDLDRLRVEVEATRRIAALVRYLRTLQSR